MATGVVVSQPVEGGKGAELNAMPMPAMQSVVLPEGLPAGLAYLSALNEVIIHQEFDVLEVLVGWEMNNKYKICNNQEQQFMYAKEDGHLGFPGTLWKMPKIYDATDKEIGQIIKHWGGWRELLGGVNDFRVQFPQEMDIFKKTLLFASTFLIDYAYFETKKNS